MIFELNTDEETKQLLEGQRRYKEMLASQYAAGYSDAEEKYAPIIADKDSIISSKDAIISNKDAIIADKDELLQKYKEKFGEL